MRLPRLAYLYPSALLHILWMFTFGLFSAKSRNRIVTLGSEAPWFKQSPQLILPNLTQDEVMGLPKQITLLEPACSNGNISFIELALLSRLAERNQPQKIFEFGTFNGRSAMNLIAAAPSDSCLYTLDLPASMAEKTHFEVVPSEVAFIDKPISGHYFKNTVYAPRITQLYGDSASFDFAPYLGQIDMVFIDASHAYDYVRCDTLNALKILRPTGGIIIWHDYTPYWSGVVQALNEFFQSDARFRTLKHIEGTTLAVLMISNPS